MRYFVCRRPGPASDSSGLCGRGLVASRLSEHLERSRHLKLQAVTSAEAKNLEAIVKAIKHHNRNCPFPAAEVRMNPFEVERLGWDEIRGLPVVPDPDIGTGRFRIVCSRDLDDAVLEEAETVGRELQAANN